ncbi:MAG: TetR/AcrR family transcriptional regulator [Clostridia bacterium]|nr:TetR/AcrR family transcriptional regulator [Clostridia bacterium]
MNKTKRKIFEASMKLFAKKGYDATSIEEITATVGVAKGTLYYHFSSKEEIFNFLVEEGMKLLKNSIDIKISKLNKAMDKLRAVILIQIKIITKYEDFMTIVLSQIWGNEARNIMCKQKVIEYIKTIEILVEEGMKKGEIMKGDPEVIASGIFGLTCASLVYKMKIKEEIDISKLYKEFDHSILKGLTHIK